MPATIPAIRIGDPLRYKSLSVFPLFADSYSDVEYRLSSAALADQSLLIEEVSRGGSVPELLVKNKSDVRVLFLEGEELIGAKQNRILNTSVLVGARSKIKIPVSCVEQGRWDYKSRYLDTSQSHSPVKLRSTLKASVSQSLKANRGHRSDQQKVWREVTHLQTLHGVESETLALSDTFDVYGLQIALYREHLKYASPATGLVVAIGEKLVSYDLFDKPATCQLVWDRLISGAVLDALENRHTACHHASGSDVQQLLTSIADLAWEQTIAVGEGEEFRAESPQGDHASVLSFQETVLHSSLVPAF